MGVRKIRWSRKATTSFLSILKWYQVERVIAQMPTVGRIDEKMSTSKSTYYSFLSHPKYRIVYRYTDTELYIVAIRAIQMNNL